MVYGNSINIPAKFSQYNVLVTRNLVIQDNGLASNISHTDTVLNQRDIIIAFLELSCDYEACERHER